MPKWQMWENKIDKRTNGRRHLRMVPTHARVKTKGTYSVSAHILHSQTFTLYPFSASAGKRERKQKKKTNYNRETKRREAWDGFFVPRIITVNSLWQNRRWRKYGWREQERRKALEDIVCECVPMTKDLWMDGRRARNCRFRLSLLSVSSFHLAIMRRSDKVDVVVVAIKRERVKCARHWPERLLSVWAIPSIS